MAANKALYWSRRRCRSGRHVHYHDHQFDTFGQFAGHERRRLADENALGILVLANDTILDNSAVMNGGGVSESGPATLIRDTTVTGNATQANAGGLEIGSASFTMNNTIVAGNFAGPMNFVGGMVSAINVTNGGTNYP